MGLAGIGIGKLLIILVIVLLFFGTKRLKNLGGDIGGAIKGFKKAIGNDDAESIDADATDPKKVNDPVTKSESK
jgi:sec-independent protein translocase protein TatA